MAVLSFPNLPANTIHFILSREIDDIFGIAGAISASATRIESLSHVTYYLNGPRTEIVDITVSGSFTYGPLATVAGTVTSITASVGGTDILALTGMNHDAGRVWINLLASGDPFTELLNGDDTVTGSDQGDHLFGYAGNDTMSGLAGTDTMRGGYGGDTLMGGAGTDTLYGDKGRDRLFGGDDNDRIHGGTQRDILMGEAGGDFLFGDGGDDRINGGLGRDFMDGGQGDDLLIGGGGRDRIRGGDNDDILRGGHRNDILSGEAGDDRLIGGTGTDIFVFQSFGRDGRSGADRIEDFEAGENIVLTYVATKANIVTQQVGSDVTIALQNNLVTVIDAALADVQAAISTQTYGYHV